MPDPMSWAWKPSSSHICSIARVFGEHVAIDAPQPFFFAVVDGALHQHPAEAMSLESRAHHDREFRRLFVELLLQAHEPEHLARLFVEPDENDVVPVEMGELLPSFVG